MVFWNDGRSLEQKKKFDSCKHKYIIDKRFKLIPYEDNCDVNYGRKGICLKCGHNIIFEFSGFNKIPKKQKCVFCGVESNLKKCKTMYFDLIGSYQIDYCGTQYMCPNCNEPLLRITNTNIFRYI